MKILTKQILVILALIGSVQAHAESISAKPVGLSCYATGSEAGKCDIVFAASTITSCSNTSSISFDPKNDLLGKEYFGMALAAVSSSRNLQVDTAGCTASGKAIIDVINYN